MQVRGVILQCGATRGDSSLRQRHQTFRVEAAGAGLLPRGYHGPSVLQHVAEQRVREGRIEEQEGSASL